MLEPLKPLSRREWEVIELLLQGKSNKLIALSLGISDRTVEFHLKNIYAKCQVSSRIELILKLGNATGALKTGYPGSSTVDSRGESTENGTGSGPSLTRVPAYSNAVSLSGKESTMKDLLFSKHALMGVLAALLTGCAWAALLKRFGHMSNDSILPWIGPLLLVLLILGAAVGAVAKRNGNTLWKVFFSTVFGTGVGAFAMVPVIGFVAYPLAKIGERLGLINRAAVSTNITSALVVVAMIGVWLLVGAAVGMLSLVIGIRKPQRPVLQRGVPEHGLS